MPKKLTQEEFIKRAIEKHGDKYDYSEAEYNGSNVKVKIFCKECKQYFWQSASDHLSGYGCKKCSKLKCITNQRLSKIDFIKKAQIIHGNLYDYSFSFYKDTVTKIKIYCKECKQFFWQTPGSHLQKRGCPYCAKRKRGMNKRSNLKIFIEKSKEKGLTKFFDFSKAVYTKAIDKMCIICKKCKREFYITPHNLLQGKGCPYCASSKGEKSLILYFTSNNITYIQQKKFKDCKDKRCLPFDFYLPDYNICIEFQGEQHYNIHFCISYNKGDYVKANKQFETIKTHDQIKRDYCKLNNITLLEIKYNDNIKETLDNFLRS